MIGSLADLASLPGMPSEPTLRDMIRADADFAGIVRRGVGKGDAWEIDLRAAASYVAQAAERKAEAQRQREADRAQLGLELGLVAPAAQAGLTVADREALLREEMTALKLGQLRGELVAKAGVEAAEADMLVWLSQQMSSFSARLAKRADVSRSLQNAIDELMARDQRALAMRLRRMAEAERDGDITGDTAAAALDAAAA